MFRVTQTSRVASEKPTQKPPFDLGPIAAMQLSLCGHSQYGSFLMTGNRSHHNLLLTECLITADRDRVKSNKGYIVENFVFDPSVRNFIQAPVVVHRIN
jgi:hypothetical protein